MSVDFDLQLLQKALGSGQSLFAPGQPDTSPDASPDPYAQVMAEETAIAMLRRGGQRIKLASPWTVDPGGELTLADYRTEAQAKAAVTEGSAEAQTKTSPQYRIKAIRSIHHQIAIMLSGGTQAIEISRTLGISAQRIYQLQQDPTFQELLQSYKASSVNDTLDAQMRSLGLGTLAMEQLMEKLLDAPEDMSPGLLLKISTEMLDRAGYSPQAMVKGAQANTLPSEDQLHAMKAAARQQQAGSVLIRTGYETQVEDSVPDSGSSPES